MLELPVLPGDGIGPETSAATNAVLERLSDLNGLGLALPVLEVGHASFARFGTTLPDAVVERVKRADGFILGPVSTADYPAAEAGGVNPSAYFRQHLDLYVNARPAVRGAWRSDGGPVFDLLIVRENTEGFYATRTMYAGAGEFMPDPDSAFAVRKVTRDAVRRVAHAAFGHARERGGRVAAVHKSNVLELSDGLFLDAVREAAEAYPEVALEEVRIDAAASLLVRDPQRFDVILTTNLFGDILSNEAAELSGGLGLGPSLNYGDRHAMAQATHGSAPEIAGTGTANPVALMASAGMLLDWLGSRHGHAELTRAAASLHTAIESTLADPETRTPDLGGALSTEAFGHAVIEHLGHDRGRCTHLPHEFRA